jgi:hypothetical protein
MTAKVRLTESHRKAIIGLALAAPCRDWFAPFKSIASNGNLAPHLVRRSVRHIARKGLAEYAKGLTNDDGELRGAGYRLTDAGWLIANEQQEVKDAPYVEY